MIKVNLKHSGLANLNQLVDEQKIKAIHQQIFQKTGPGSDYLGWLNWPEAYDKAEFQQMQAVANKLRKRIQYLVVIGIGGSYLGTRAADEMIRGLYPDDQVQLIYVGNTLSSTYMVQLQTFLKDKNFGIVVISKSGTTTEPGVAFRIFEAQLINQVGVEQAKELIVAITDANKGALRTLALEKGYPTFTIPDDIGGRFSVLTPVGIFPLMVAGIHTEDLLVGAQQAQQELMSDDLTNPAYQYAVARYLLHQQGYQIEAFVSYELQMQMVGEWWKQLFGESEGKVGKSLFPTTLTYTTDLHSLGQWVQEGPRKVLFETVVKVNQPGDDLAIPSDQENFDGLNYLTNHSMHEINTIALEGVVQAHVEVGQMPNIILELEKMDGKMFGYLVYWFERAVAMSAYLLEVNPFNQPGVEVYKHSMFTMLGKPGIN